MAVTPADSPSTLIAGLVRWVRNGPTLSGVPTVEGWLPAIEPARPKMPAVYCHLLALPDARESFNGRGGVRQRTYRCGLDVWWHISTADPAAAQADAADLVELVVERVVSEPTWDGLVTHSGGNVDVRLLDDTYDDILAGRGVIAWRIAVDAHLYPIAT